MCWFNSTLYIFIRKYHISFGSSITTWKTVLKTLCVLLNSDVDFVRIISIVWFDISSCASDQFQFCIKNGILDGSYGLFCRLFFDSYKFIFIFVSMTYNFIKFIDVYSENNNIYSSKLSFILKCFIDTEWVQMNEVCFTPHDHSTPSIGCNYSSLPAR